MSRNKNRKPRKNAVAAWEAYERAKAELADAACSAAEYEAGLRALAERMGL